MEKGLSELWCTILRLPTVGVNQDFLDVGGDSITAMQLLNQVRTKFAVNLSIIDFFDAATIQEQSQLIEKELV
ncbi:MAG: acyl carrier protein [Chloroflexota bacterium]